MKKFLIPCFVIAEAETMSEARQLAKRHSGMKNGSVLLMDSKLPTMEIPNYPDTMKKPLFARRDANLKETIQHDLLALMDGLPQDAQDRACQIVVNAFKKL